MMADIAVESRQHRRFIQLDTPRTDFHRQQYATAVVQHGAGRHQTVAMAAGLKQGHQSTAQPGRMQFTFQPADQAGRGAADQFTGRRIGVLVCGGNIDVTLLSRIIERGLVKDGRLVRLRIHLPDHPGSLHRLTHIITENDANIVETLHDRAYYGVNLGDTVIDITMETRGPEHIASLMQSLLDAGFPHDRVQ